MAAAVTQRRRSDPADRGKPPAAQRAVVLLSRDAGEVRRHLLG